jgi:tRNA modification GTPase
MATPGEFTRRAYLNGKLDLIRAEAVNDLITASGSKATSSALSQLRGTLTGFLETLLKEIQSCRIKIELAIDFSDQDLPQIDMQGFAAELDTIIEKAERLVEESRSGRYIREGIKICLVGPPNAGRARFSFSCARTEPW